MSRNDLRLNWEAVIPRPLDEVFAFFAEAANLERITPPELRFEILPPVPDEMHQGALIKYRLRLFGLGFGWTTVISAWDPPRSFTDVQLKGPYRKWEHTHTFAAEGDNTRVRDEVLYRLPLEPLDMLVRPLIRLQLQRIFGYRERRLREILG